ncbi:hypothetical protein [Kribbella sp. CA-293567]|uniref:hypothetical protein n=1 Tax=Kribbella sp. CA-293567 TaxID=3002436 RepID=UPI0022DCF770|nr:hypothetical protein [Kribbella sp. CA-293567]WBQ05524.1 hypothetical protein OX958_01710 [Kribbella sp. CA-293567]
MLRRRLRLPVAAGASLLIAASSAGLASTQAVAAPVEDNPVVDVAIDSFSPLAPVPGQAVTITGRITNTSQSTFQNSQATACIHRERLATAAAVAAVPTELDVPMKDRNQCVGLTNPEGTTLQRYDAPLAPKSSVTFKLVVPWNEWKISSQPGVYSVGVRFRGDLTRTFRTTAGLSRILMPVVAKTPPRKVNAALVVPLTHRPTLLANRLFANESLAESMAPNGDLGRLLTLGRKRVVSWLVDPAMIDEARVIANSESYQVEAGPGRSKAGTGRSVVKAWLSAFDESRKVNPVVLLPYGDPDVATLASAGPPVKQIVTVARTRSAGFDLRLPAPSNPTGLWLDGGELTAKTLSAGAFGFAGLRGDELNIVQSSSWPATERPNLQSGPFARILTPESPSPGQVNAVIADSTLLAGGPDPATAKQPLQLRQRFAAETSLLAGTGTGQATVAVVPPRGWETGDTAPISAVLDAMASPWITPVGIDRVTAGEPKVTTRLPTSPPAAGGLDDSQLNGIQGLTAATATYDQLLSQATSSDTRNMMSEAMMRASSTEWTAFPEEGQRYVAYQRAAVEAQLKLVHLVTNTTKKGQQQGIKVNLSGSKGSFPLTVENGLDVSIRVGLQVTATGNRNDLRISVERILTLPAGQKGTFQVQASAEQNGLINATAQLVTLDKRPVGESQQLVIQAAQYGSVGWILVGAAVALLFGTSIVRIYRRVRSERRNPAKPEGDALHPAPLSPEDLAPAPDDSAGSPATPEPPATSNHDVSDRESLKEGVGTKDG